MAASDAQAEPIGDDLRVIHVLNRLSLGPAPGDIDRVKRIGVQRYIHEQLNPDSIPEPGGLVREMAGLETISMSPIALFIKYQIPLNQARKSLAQERGLSASASGFEADPEVRAAQKRRRIVLQQAMAARLRRALEGPRQLQEVMADFWFNHFNVFAGKGPDLIWTGAYEHQALRPHTLGRFRDLLGATAKHPAMLFYLDNWQNTASGSPGARGKQEGINENYARELMELHTLGVDGGYTQADVIALARILTGWGLPRPGINERRGPLSYRRRRFRVFEYPEAGPARWTGDGFLFDASRHDFGEKIFLGHTIRGSGIDEGEQALDILARSPATAQRLSFKLAQYFVADQPPPSLVKKLAVRFLQADGDIRAVLAALFDSDEFWQKRYFGAKFKTPYQYVLSAVRATAIPVRNFRPLLGAIARLGMPLYQCQTPDGYKNTQAAWLNPDAMMRRLDFATALGAGRLRLDAPPSDDGVGTGAVKGAAFGSAPEPADAAMLAATLGGNFGEQTAAAMEAAPEELRGAVILGSPEFMRK